MRVLCFEENSNRCFQYNRNVLETFYRTLRFCNERAEHMKYPECVKYNRCDKSAVLSIIRAIRLYGNSAPGYERYSCPGKYGIRRQQKKFESRSKSDISVLKIANLYIKAIEMSVIFPEFVPALVLSIFLRNVSCRRYGKMYT